jgi:hypothetical protein
MEYTEICRELLSKEHSFVEIKPFNKINSQEKTQNEAVSEAPTQNRAVMNWLLEHAKELKKRSLNLKDMHCYGKIINSFALSQFTLRLETFNPRYFMVYGNGDKNKSIEVDASKSSGLNQNNEMKDSRNKEKYFI